MRIRLCRSLRIRLTAGAGLNGPWILRMSRGCEDQRAGPHGQHGIPASQHDRFSAAGERSPENCALDAPLPPAFLDGAWLVLLAKHDVVRRSKQHYVVAGGDKVVADSSTWRALALERILLSFGGRTLGRPKG